MTAPIPPSTGTQAAPSPQAITPVDKSSWELRDWIRQLHGANRVLSQNPNDQGAQDAVNNAWAYLGQQQAAGKQADITEAGRLAPGVLGDVAAGVVGFGRGASLGATRLVTGKEALDAITAAHPKSTLIGDALGTSATLALGGEALAAAKVPAAYAGATLMGGSGAIRGYVDPFLTGDRTFDAIMLGLGGVVGGAVIGKVGEKVVAPIWRTLTPAIRNTGMKMAAYFGSRGMGPAEAEEAAVSKLRQYLTNLPEASRPSNEAIESQLQTVRSSFRKAVPVRPLAAGHDAPPIPRAAADELAKPTHLSIPRGEDLRAQQPLTPAEAALAKTPPPEQSYAAAHPPPSEPIVPEGTHPADIERIRRGTMSVADLRAQQQQLTNPGSILRSLEAKKGSPLTDEERDRVLQNLLGKKGSRPNHPIWYGPGSPTISP